MASVDATGPWAKGPTTVGRFLAELFAVLEAMVEHPGCFVVTAEFEDRSYVQFWVEPDGKVIAEVVSNQCLGGVGALSAENEWSLLNDGWSHPKGIALPNWWCDARDVDSLRRVVARIRRVVLQVLGEHEQNSVVVKSWPVGRELNSSDLDRYESRVLYRDALRSIRRDLDGWAGYAWT